MEFLSFFKSKYYPYLLCTGFGFLICLYLTKSGCVSNEKIKLVDTGGWVEHHTDTIYVPISNNIPTPKIVYRDRIIIDSIVISQTQTQTKTDSFDNLTVESDTTLIPINHYTDTIKTEDYEFNYTIETFGFLTSFTPNITTYNKVVDRWQTQEKITKPNWLVGVGVSNQLNYKVSVGYKGWLLEPEFKDIKFNQIYLTKQFNF